MPERIIKAWLENRLQPLAILLARVGLRPNTLTILGLVLTLLPAALIASSRMVEGGLMLLVAGGFDLLDGVMARSSGQVSRFGAFLDSVVDRYSEAIIYGALLALYGREPPGIEVWLIFATLVGSMMVSYTRARAEGLGVECSVGLLGRAERLLLLSFGLILSWVYPVLLAVLWILAILTNLTAIQRIIHVWRLTKD